MEHHGADGILGAQQGLVVVLIVVLGVEGVFHRHGTRDAAHVHVGFHGAAVGAALQLALVLGHQLLGLVLKNILAAGVADLFHGVQQQARHHIDLVVDLADVAGEGVGGREGIPVQHAHLVGHAGHGVEQLIRGVAHLVGGAGHVDGVLLGQPVDDVRRLAGGVGQALHALVHHPHGHGQVAEGGAGEGGVGLQDAQRLFKIRKGVAQLFGGVAQGVQAVLDGACARNIEVVQFVKKIGNLLENIVVSVQGFRHGGKRLAPLGVSIGFQRLAGGLEQAAHCAGHAGQIADGTAHLPAGIEEIAVVGEERRAAHQAEAGGQQFHLAADAGAHAQHAHGCVGDLQKAHRSLDLIVDVIVGQQRVTAGDGIDGPGQLGVVAAFDGFEQFFQTVADLLQALLGGIHGVAGGRHARAGFGQCGRGRQHLGGHFRGDPLELADGIGHFVQRIGGSIHHRLQPGHGVGEELARAVHFVRHIVEVIAALVLQAAGRVDGIGHVGIELVQVLIQRAGAVVHIVCRAVDHIVQGGKLGAQLVEGAFIEVEVDVRLCLPGNAAHVLAALNIALVHAAGDEAIGAAGNAAHIIAHMGIADAAGVRAAQKEAGAAARDAAGVGGHVGDGVAQVGPHILLDVFQQGGREALHIKARVLILGVHRTHIGAARDGAEVVAHDAAGLVGAGDDCAGIGVVDGAGGLVAACNAAHFLLAHHRAREGAADEDAVVAAHDAARHPLGVGRLHQTLDGQVPHRAALLHDAEKARRSVSPGDLHAGDGVAVAQKGTAERGDGGPLPFQLQVFLQHHGLVFGPGIVAALFCKRFQIGNAVDGYGLALHGFLAVGQHRDGHRRQQSQREQRRHKAVEQAGAARRRIMFHHGCPPPALPVEFCPKARSAGRCRPQWRSWCRSLCRSPRPAPCR